MKKILITATWLLFGLTSFAQGTDKSNGNRGEILTFAEQMPEFPGGNEAMTKFLSSSLQYPAKARENSIQGRLIYQFIVEQDGFVSNIELIGKKLGYGLEEEAERVLNAMPRWKPGYQSGKPVTVKFTLPIQFRLQ